MKTLCKQLLSVMMVASCLFSAKAVVKTYVQHNITEVKNCQLDGIADNVEIGYTAQLAFPGKTLDEIQGCQFITKLQANSLHEVYGIYPHYYKVNGSVQKMALQFSVVENVNEKNEAGETVTRAYTKTVSYILTNGSDGVYVQKFGSSQKKDNGGTYPYIRMNFLYMDGNGNVTYTTGGEKPDEAWTSGSGGFRSYGLRIFGVMPTPKEKRLAFPGAKLKQLVGAKFFSSIHVGGGLDHPNYDGEAECVTLWPSSEDVQKIVMQFRNPNQSNRASVVELTEGDGGVYIQQRWAKNSAGNSFSLDDNGNVIDSGYFNASGEYGSYIAWGVYTVPDYTYVRKGESILLWTKKGGTLTLNDLVGAKFTAQFGGAWVNGGTIKNLMGTTLCDGYNTREIVDENGDITKIITEFQFGGSDTKAVIVAFTNGVEGVYASAIDAMYSPSPIGRMLTDNDGNYYYAKGGWTTGVATSMTSGSYGVCDLRAVANTAKVYRQGPTYTFAVVNTESPGKSTQLPKEDQVAFAGLKLEDLSDKVFVSYMESGAISGRYVFGKFPWLYPTADAAEKLLVQFTAAQEEPGGHNKSAFVQFGYNDKGAVTINKVHNTWSTTGNEFTVYYSDKFFELGPNDVNSYQNMNDPNCHNNSIYELWGLRIFPGYVQTTPTLLFKNATLDELENAEFTAIAAGLHIGVAAVNDRAKSYNKKIIRDGEKIVKMLVEFQYSDGSYTKAVIVEFTDDASGVWGTTKEARFVRGSALGYNFVTQYDGSDTITYAGDDSSPATSHLTGGYGVYDVQATVEPTGATWDLDEDSVLSYYTEGVPLDDDSATLHIKAKAGAATFTIDENITVGKIVFENATGGDSAVLSLVVAQGVSANIGGIDVGKGMSVALPSSMGGVSVNIAGNAMISYDGPVAVSGTLSGDGSVVVRSGRVTFEGANSFAGGLTVKSGAVAIAGNYVAKGADKGPFGVIDAGQPAFVTVEDGGMVDINGKSGLAYRFSLAGTGVATGDIAAPGPLVNLGAPLKVRIDHVEWNEGHARGIKLLSDITLGAAGNDLAVVTESNWENPKYGCYLELGANTLTKDGKGTLYFWSDGLTVAGEGTLNIVDGAVDVRQGSYNGAESKIVIGADGVLRIGAEIKASMIENNGAIEVTHVARLNKVVKLTGEYSGNGALRVLSGANLTIDDTLTVGDFVNNGTVNGDGTLTVGGTLTPGNDLSRLTLAQGAKIKLAGTDEASIQKVTDTLSITGKVTVDASAISPEDMKLLDAIPVISAPQITAEDKRNLSVSGVDNRTLMVKTVDGMDILYMKKSGFMVIVR